MLACVLPLGEERCQSVCGDGPEVAGVPETHASVSPWSEEVLQQAIPASPGLRPMNACIKSVSSATSSEHFRGSAGLSSWDRSPDHTESGRDFIGCSSEVRRSDSSSPGSPVSVCRLHSRASGVRKPIGTPRERANTGGVHPTSTCQDIKDSIKFVDASAFGNLQTPLPRCQDMSKDCFGVPTSNDLVVAVSHGWRNQTHPDPNGWKRDVVRQFLSEMNSGSEAGYFDRTFIFFDFLSMTQSPFRPDQPPRTQAEEVIFQKAMKCMHRMYFLADRILHLGFREEDLEGEGEEYVVLLKELFDAKVAPVGDWFQIVGRNPDYQGSPRKSPKRWSLYDRIVSVRNEPIQSIKDWQEKCNDQEHRLSEVKCVRYPFGRVNSIKADERGWVFLERFITAVKVAMLDEEQAGEVVITDSEDVLKEILSFAEKLRQAAAEEKLDELMVYFQEELGKKHFNAASTDKLNCPAHEPDAEIVTSIMNEFAKHLASSWTTEAAAQRKRASRFGKNLADYFPDWKAFSEELFREVTTHTPWYPPLLLACLPPLLATPVFWLDYGSPNEPWGQQALFWGLCAPVMCFLSALGIPFVFGEFAGIRSQPQQAGKYLAWTFVLALILSAVCLVLGDALTSESEPPPVPLLVGYAVGLSFLAIPFICCTMPAHFFKTPDCRRRLAWAFFACAAAHVVFGGVMPYLSFLLQDADAEGVRMFIILLFLAVKLGYERTGNLLHAKLGADVVPPYTAIATVNHRAVLCTAMASGLSLFPFLELILVDVLDNGYQIFFLHRHFVGNPQDRALRDGDISVRDRDIAGVLSALLIKEFLQLTTLLGFLFEVVTIRELSPRNFDLICSQSATEFERTIMYLLLDLVVVVVAACFSWRLLVYNNIAPMKLLRGLLARFLPVFLAVATSANIFALARHHSHAGMDLSFKFYWRGGGAQTWICGLQYERGAS